MARSYAELMGLEVEAERLVRCGESRADVARRLGVHPSTLSIWALRGGWRQKDLDLERSADAARETVMAIRHGNRQADAQKLAREQLGGFMREAVALLAEGSEASLRKLAGMVGAIEAPKRLEAPKVVLGPDPKTGHLEELGTYSYDANGDRIDEAQRLEDEANVETPETLRAWHDQIRAEGKRVLPKRGRPIEEIDEASLLPPELPKRRRRKRGG